MIFNPERARDMVKGRLTTMFMPHEGKTPKCLVGENYSICPRSERVDRRAEPSIGRFKVDSIRPVQVKEIDQNKAQAAGYSDLQHFRSKMATLLKQQGEPDPEAWLWCMEFTITQVEDGPLPANSKPLPIVAHFQGTLSQIQCTGCDEASVIKGDLHGGEVLKCPACGADVAVQR